MTDRLELLRCPQCATPVALADAPAVTCPACGAEVVVPAAHRAAYANARDEVETRAEARALYAQLGAPPRALRVIGVMFDPSAPIKRGRTSPNPLVRLLAWYYGWVAVVAAPAAMLMLVLIAGALVFRVLGGWQHANLMDTLPVATRDWLQLPPAFAALLAGIALGVYGRRRAISRHRLQASLAARPPSRDGGPRECRGCGAPLTVPADALGVRCAYCGADNLVALPPQWLDAVGADVAKVAGAIDEASVALAQERRRLRRVLAWELAITTAVLAGICTIALVTGADSRPDDRVPPSWSAYATTTRPLLRRDVLASAPKQAGPRLLADRVSVMTFEGRCPAAARPLPVAPADCNEHGCEVRLYAALRAGDRATVALEGVPAGAHVEVARHTGWVWPERVGGEFGPSVATLDDETPGFVATWSAWHQLDVVMPSAPAAATICFEIARGI